jgi:hypothetical protein
VRFGSVAFDFKNVTYADAIQIGNSVELDSIHYFYQSIDAQSRPKQLDP